MIKYFILILLLTISFSARSNTLNLTINASLTIVNSPCQATYNKDSIIVNCQETKKIVKTVIKKNEKFLTDKNVPQYLVTIIY